MRNKRSIAFVLITGLLILSQARAATFEIARTYDEIIESGFIRVGVYKDFPPYSWVDNGKPAGIDVHVAEEIAKGLNLDLKLHWITPDENLEDDLRNNVWKGHYLGGGVADVMLRVPYDREYSLMRDDIGELVHEQVVMLAPYQSERWQITFNNKKLDRVSTVAVFQYHPIGVEIDSLPAFYMTSALNGRFRNNTRHFHSILQAFDAMLAGDVDAVMGMQSRISWLQGNSGKPNIKLAENGFPTMGKQLWDIGIAIKHTNRQLGYAVGDILEEQVLSGKLEQWFNSQNIVYGLPEYYREVQ